MTGQEATEAAESRLPLLPNGMRFEPCLAVVSEIVSLEYDFASNHGQ